MFITFFLCKDEKILPPPKKLFYELNLDGLVPREDFYRKVNEYLDLHFLYKATEKYYGSEGQQSIDPVVFFQDIVGWLFEQHQQWQGIAPLLFG